MKIELQFRDKKLSEDFPAVPGQGEIVRLDAFDRDLRVKHVIWTRDRVSLELEDPTGGHIWEGGPEGWGCQRCGWMVISSVPPEHPNFPGTEAKRNMRLSDCDEEIAKSVQNS
jgi:hypothetical protein